tara:strand:+ start:475 stop:1410 length:936 start_codon:yes stop_codon:yes gene_type:complete
MFNFIFKILSIFLLLQNIASSTELNKIIANIESQIITSYELKNKIKTILVLSNQELNQDNINKTKNQAMTTLINHKLKKEEVLKFNITENKVATNNHLISISKKYKTNVVGLKKLFDDYGLNFDYYFDEINTEYSWQKLIFKLYNTKIVLDENEINKELNESLSKQEDIEEFKLAEIEILIEGNLSNSDLINQINDQISKIGFENTAIKFSTSSSALDGGNIGWINSKSLTNNIKNLIKKMNIGDVSDPIEKSNSITFLKLLDKKVLDKNNLDLKLLKNKIIERNKNELFNLYSNSYLSKLKSNAFIQIKY